MVINMKKTLLKPLSFLPALLMMALIFGFSSQNGEASGNLSYQVSYKIVEIGNNIFDTPLDDDQLHAYARKIEFPVRKLAHMTEYFLLALCAALPCRLYGLKGRSLLLTVFFVCVIFAAGDEYHQSFVADRGPSVRDVGIDSIGAGFGVIAVHIFCRFLLPALQNRKTNKTIRFFCLR